MELQTISQISKTFNLSTRTLRYYEQIGLVHSEKKEGYAYRVYSEETVKRLQQIVILRKLRIPLKQIANILENNDAKMALAVFQNNIAEIDEEVTALSTIKSIMTTFVTKINESLSANIKLDILSDGTLTEIVDAIEITKIKLKDEKTAEDLEQASERLNKLTDRDVRIVYLPPATVAAYHYTGDEPEHHVAMVTDKFVVDNNLPNIYTGLRHFGFNNPNPVDETNYHGYEMWVTIPDDMDVAEPLVKKHFEGGLYAAHMIPMGAFEEWDWLFKWTNDNDKYEYRGTWDSANMFGCLEENLNYINNVTTFTDGRYDNVQLDLLMPVKPRFAAATRHPQEIILETFNYNGIPVEVVQWNETIWCGKIGYAVNNTDEPDVEPILNGFMALDATTINERVEPDWDVCMSVNYLSAERPNGVMFGNLVGTDNQPDNFDVYKLPAGQYIRISLNDEAAFAVGDRPWNGGIPPYKWVGEQLAPIFGYRYGSDNLPFFEYYGFFNQTKNAHEFRYLYVPVEKI